ncbi:MAG: hypothetical protein R2788_01040 [Saprospiraceae bacterium]
MNNHLPYQGCARSLTKTSLTLIWGFLFLLGFSANLTAQDCCDQGDKVKSLTMRYTGESCSATNTSQASDKYDCSGNPNSDPSVYIVVSEKENGTGKIYFTGNVALNQTFTASAANANTNEFKAKTFFRIFSSQGGSLLQLVEIHTSCSAPIVTGEQVGSMRIESVIFKNNFNCGPPPDPCTATFTNEGTQVGRLWQFFGNNQWSSTYTTIQPGATVTKNVGDGQVWQIWNVADNQMFAAFTIDCDEDNDYCFTQSGPTSCTPPEVCPTPVINAPNQQICRGEAVTFTAPDLGFPCLDYTWNFGGNATPSTATGKGPISVVFSSTGNINVSLSIDNDCNNTTPPNPPLVFGCCNQDERGEHDHPHQLILEYVGGGSTNVIFRATDNGPFTFFSGQVSTGDIFVVDGTGHTDKHGELNRLDTDTEFKIGNSSYKEVHTSCSQDISPGYGINSNGDLIQNGTSSNSVFIVRGIVMLNTGSGSSIYCEEGITDPNGGGGGNPANGTTVCGSDCFDCEKTTTVTVTVVECDPCAGQGGDTDGDGVCNNQDCAPNNPNLPTTPGTACNDGNPATVNDVIQADGCSCAGTPLVCNLNATFTVANGCLDDAFLLFADANDPYVPPTNPLYTYSYDIQPQSSVAGLFTTDPRSINVTFNSPGVKTVTATITNPAIPNCQIIKVATFNVEDCSDPCINQGGDSDNDGICDNDDCAPTNPNLPTTPGTACNDGNPNTSNDVIQADGCSCAGTPVGGPDCEEDIDITVGNGKITVTGLEGAPVSSLQIFNASWQQEFTCFANCSATETISVAPGTYYVYAKYYTASYGLICEKQATVTVTGGCPDADNDGTCDVDDCQPNDPFYPTAPGTPCNDGNPNTTNDVVTANGCGCQGTPVGCPDADNDGTCDVDDCQPNDPFYPAAPGTPCNDGDPNTTNDVVTANGCGCQGAPVGTPDCEEDIDITTGNGTIIVSGLGGAPVSSLQVFTATWQPVFSCFANCNGTETISVPPGTYLIYAKYYTAGYQLICEKHATVTVGGGGPCTNVTNGGTIGFGNGCTGATDYCPNQGPAPIVKNCVAPSGGAGNLEIVWLKSTTSCDYPTTTADEIAQGLDPHWTMIPGATGLEYSPDNVTQQTCFLRCARRAGCPTFIESNIVTLGISNNCNGGSGGTPNCANIGINTGLGTITVTGLDGAPVTSVQIFSAAWQTEHTCFANCNSPMATFSVTAGAHYVYVKYYTAQYQLICEVNQTVNVPIALGTSQSQYFQFEAVKQLEHTELLWVHQGDYFVSTYALERSADGIEFEEIYNVPSEQDAFADVYEGYDLEPLTGFNHYRVKMLNLDGTVSYSEVKTVEFQDRIDFVIFPNPANEFTNINLESIIGFKDVDIHVYNNMGVRLKHFHLDEVSSRYYQMDLRELHEGHYSVWVNIPGRRAQAVQMVIGRL